ncbi:MAG: hypothetical protein ACTHJR_03140 [Sphingomonas sp.]
MDRGNQDQQGAQNMDRRQDQTQDGQAGGGQSTDTAAPDDEEGDVTASGAE